MRHPRRCDHLHRREVKVAHVLEQRGDDLGSHEAEIARLIAEGLTNKPIGTRLFISQRTVDAHVRNILNKLGVDTRAQIAVRVAPTNMAAEPATGWGAADHEWGARFRRRLTNSRITEMSRIRGT
ncbi:MAG: LuxR C-terminal-related transcriptional regulator [Candidatus Dormibacteraceae bacterium]